MGFIKEERKVQNDFRKSINDPREKRELALSMERELRDRFSALPALRSGAEHRLSA